MLSTVGASPQEGQSNAAGRNLDCCGGAGAALVPEGGTRVSLRCPPVMRWPVFNHSQICLGEKAKEEVNLVEILPPASQEDKKTKPITIASLQASVLPMVRLSRQA